LGEDAMRLDYTMGVAAEDEFTAFVEMHEPKLRIALMAAYGPERGREATCEALAYGWEHWDRVRTMERPIGYLYRVGQSKSRPRKTPRPDPVVATHGDPWVEPGLPAALGALSRKQRMAVVLVDAYGWTRREAAEVIGVSEDTVGTHLRRGLHKLRASLGVSADV
jgi:DNA-directed RNA polymerase specialized sigma24 family protein